MGQTRQTAARKTDGVERLQDITEKQALTEGIVGVPFRPDDGWPICTGYMVGPDDGKTGLHPDPRHPAARLA